MIVTQLMGGLGNQLFQYAAGRALANRHGVPLRLDLAWFGRPQPGGTRRRYGLDAFAFPARALTLWERGRAIGEWPDAIAGRLLRRLHGVPTHRRVEEEQIPGIAAFLALPERVCLFGYWCSEAYFAGVAGALRSEFRLRQPPRGRNADVAARIAAAPDSVAFHVRRGDYVSNPVFARVFPVCPPEYYRDALAALRRTGPVGRVFVFGDDPAWARASLDLPADATFIDWNQDEATHPVDLWLMSRCRHHIIANSTFGWWGAWLAASPGQRVVAPTRWLFAADPPGRPPRLPDAWIRV